MGDLKTSYDFWLAYDELFMDLCQGLIVYKMDGWHNSKGVAYEIEYMGAKPVFFIEPTDLDENVAIG
jgi:hypothetical protein